MAATAATQGFSMLRLMLPSLAVCAMLLLGTALRADDKARDVLKHAIAARGGEEKLSKMKGYRESSRGSIAVMGMEIEFEAQTIAAPPTRMRTDLEMELSGTKHTVKVRINGDSIKRSIDGKDLEMQDAEKEDGKQRMQVSYAMRLVPLLNDKTVQIKSLADAIVDGKETDVVQVSGKAIKETKFYFDRNTHLLTKVEYEGLGPSGNKGKLEMRLSEYKEFDGIKQPTKMTFSNDGTKFLEQTLTEYKVLDKIDEKDLDD
jgi:hypothetical protein